MFDTKKFIVLVQEKPSLWNICSKEYSDREMKSSDWLEISKTMITNWDELDQNEKMQKVSFLNKYRLFFNRQFIFI